MGWHLRPYASRCEQAGCHSRATDELFNTYNASYGRYCKVHARRLLKQYKEKQS